MVIKIIHIINWINKDKLFLPYLDRIANIFMIYAYIHEMGIYYAYGNLM